MAKLLIDEPGIVAGSKTCRGCRHLGSFMGYVRCEIFGAFEEGKGKIRKKFCLAAEEAARKMEER